MTRPRDTIANRAGAVTVNHDDSRVSMTIKALIWPAFTTHCTPEEAYAFADALRRHADAVTGYPANVGAA